MKKGRVWAFDIECADWDVFILGAAVSDDGEVREFWTVQQVRDWYAKTTRADMVLAHNGGKYDFLFLLDACRDVARWTASLAGSALVSISSRDNAECRDTFRLFPMSLAKWTGQKDEWDHADTKVGMSKAKKRALMEYCLQDCRALLHAWERDIERAESLGIQIKNKRGQIRRTLGNVAWHTAVEFCPLAETRQLDWSEYGAARNGYYGGRCEVFRVTADAGHRYDINSAYPWALTQPVPLGRPRRVFGAKAIEAAARGAPGIYEARVFLPESIAPFLPHRSPNGSLIWAHGVVSGYWTHVEIQSAKAYGARILSIRSALVYPDEKSVYRPYLEYFYRERNKAKADGESGWAGFLKLLLNSLTGKLAQQAESHTLFVREPPRCRCKRPPCRCTKWLGKDIFIQKVHRIPASARPAQAAVLTARARGVLLERILRAGDGAVYCDTDSTYSLTEDDTGVDDSLLGGWGYEGPMYDWLALAPKVYRYRDDDGGRAKAKGIPRADYEDVGALYRGEDVSKRVGVEGVRTALKRHGLAFTRKEVRRGLRSDRRVAGCRYIGRTGETHALHLNRKGDYQWPVTNANPLEILPRLRKVG